MFDVINAGNSGIARRVNKSRVVDPRDTRKFPFIFCRIITSFILLRVKEKGIVNVCLRGINVLWKSILGRIRERESGREQRRNTLDERVAPGAILRRKDQRGRRNSKWMSERILCTLFWCTGSADRMLPGLIISLESSGVAGAR